MYIEAVLQVENKDVIQVRTHVLQVENKAVLQVASSNKCYMARPFCPVLEQAVLGCALLDSTLHYTALNGTSRHSTAS